jgi:hypothetical protein
MNSVTVLYICIKLCVLLVLIEVNISNITDITSNALRLKGYTRHIFVVSYIYINSSMISSSELLVGKGTIIFFCQLTSVQFKIQIYSF